jgi:hypothetical protein
MSLKYYDQNKSQNKSQNKEKCVQRAFFCSGNAMIFTKVLSSIYAGGAICAAGGLFLIKFPKQRDCPDVMPCVAECILFYVPISLGYEITWPVSVPLTLYYYAAR